MVYITLSSLDCAVVLKQWWGQKQLPMCQTYIHKIKPFSSVQFISVAQSCLTLCDPRNRSTPSLPVHHQLLEFTQTHVH